MLPPACPVRRRHKNNTRGTTTDSFGVLSPVGGDHKKKSRTMKYKLTSDTAAEL